jgi:hypothetical protein
MSAQRDHIFAVIAGTVLVLGLARAALVVAHAPVLGYVSGDAAPGQGMGFFFLALIAAIAVATALALRRHPVASTVHALLFFLIVADPVATLWLNSPNAERWGLVGTYGLAAMVAVVSLGRAGLAHRIILAAAVLALAAFAIGRVHDEPPAAPGPSLVPTVLEDLGGEEPLRWMRDMARSLAAASALAPASLEVSSQGRVRRIADLPPRVMSFLALISTVPATVSMMIAMGVILTFPFALLWLVSVARRRTPDGTAIPALYATLVAITAFTALAAVLGPQAADLARSQWLGSLTLLAAVALLPLVAWHLARDFWAGHVGLAVIFGIVLLAAGWFAWARSEPLALGTVERVSAGANRTLEVGGWALDPRGVKRVYATVGGGPETTATLGTERPDLQAVYPGYPNALTGGFQMTLASNAWREDQPLRVFVENRTGAVTEIDRRIVKLTK